MRATPGRSSPKSFTRPSVKRVTPVRSPARHPAKRASSPAAPASAGSAGDQLREHRRIAQPQVEALAGHRVQRLRGVADQHRALRHAAPWRA